MNRPVEVQCTGETQRADLTFVYLRNSADEIFDAGIKSGLVGGTTKAPLLLKEGWQPLRLTGWFSMLFVSRLYDGNFPLVFSAVLEYYGCKNREGPADLLQVLSRKIARGHSWERPRRIFRLMKGPVTAGAIE